MIFLSISIIILVNLLLLMIESIGMGSDDFVRNVFLQASGAFLGAILSGGN